MWERIAYLGGSVRTGLALPELSDVGKSYHIRKKSGKENEKGIDS